MEFVQVSYVKRSTGKGSCYSFTDHNKYTYFENKLFKIENVFYNFDKSVGKIKFSIRFQLVDFFKVVKIWYIKNENYRLIFKNYGL